jgi:ribosomal silencing factor RsfS
MTQGAWIYESPDRGKTVTRRKAGMMNKEIKGLNADWVVIDDIFARIPISEESIREKYPAVQEAWDNYQILLKLAMGAVDE